MSRNNALTHHLNIQGSPFQLEAEDLGPTALSEDFDAKLHKAQRQLELLQSRQEQLERQKQEIQALNAQKQEFLEGQMEITEKLSGALTAIDRELFEMQQEVTDLQQTRKCFAVHLEKIDRINPEAWRPESLVTELSKSIETLRDSEDEYSQAMHHFSGGRSRGIFGGSNHSGKGGLVLQKTDPSERFSLIFKKGLAFNLPLLFMVLLGLLAYLTK